MQADLYIETLRPKDIGYALSCWRESHKQSPDGKRVPWSFYKHRYNTAMTGLLQIDAPDAIVLGAYRESSPEVVGFLIGTRGKRVDTLHWVYVKHSERRHGVMTALLEAADLGDRFVYTMRGQNRDGVSFDKTLVSALATRGVLAAYEPLLEWVK